MAVSVPGRFVAALAREGGVRVMVVVADGPAEELRERHGLEGAAAVLAAEGLVASLLLSAHVKGDERLTVNVRAERPSFAFVADVNGDGTLRARFTPPTLPDAESFEGILAVVKSLGPKELYKGLAEVRDERFDHALHRYLTTSQQVDARVRIQAQLGETGRVVFAAGLLVERLPDFPAEDFVDIFDTALEGDFRDLMTSFAFGELAGGPVEVLGMRDLAYRCTCSHERVVNMLRALGQGEVAGILADQGQAEVTCHFCNSCYTVDADGLAELLIELAGPPE